MQDFPCSPAESEGFAVPRPLEGRAEAHEGVKGPLRRDYRRALDSSGPLWSLYLEGENSVVWPGRECDYSGGEDRDPLHPGSEFGLHRQWFVDSAMDELLETDFAVAAKDRLYRCLDRVLPHKQELFVWLRQKWADLFHSDFEVLLYDLTSTYFEGELEQNPKAKRGYSRDKRPDCLQLVIALVVTTDGLPLAYEVMEGNTSDRTTLPGFLKEIEETYGKARRVWVMDRGIPSEAILQDMRDPERQAFYLVGTPKSRINQHEKKWLDLPWQKVRDSVEVKLYEHEGELYVLAKSGGRQAVILRDILRRLSHI